MRKFSLKIAVGIFAFIIGIFAVGLWFVYPLSLTQTFDISMPAVIETEAREEYAVYSVVINSLILKDKSSLKRLTISNETSFYDNSAYLEDTTFEQRLQDLKKYYQSVGEETLIDYELKNVRPSKIRPDFNLPIEYLLVNEKDTEKSKGRAAALMVRLSKVGFNQERNEAFVYIEYFCPLCGFGSYVHLEKESGLWKIKERFGGWVS